MNLIKNIQKYKVVGIRKTSDIRAIIIHHTAGNRNNTIPVMSNKEYGYHFTIDRGGNVTQLADTLDVVQHIHLHNKECIGIVLHGNFDNDTPSEQEILSVIELCKYLNEQTSRKLPIYAHGEYVDQNTACCGKNLKKQIERIRKEVDNKEHSWSKTPIDIMKDLGITDGTRMQSYSTREEVVTMLYRLYEVLKK